MKITFGKFEGPMADENAKSVYLNGTEIAWIERQIVWKEPTTGMGAYHSPKVVGYTLVVLDGPEAAGPLLPLDGREFETLGECQRVIKAAYNIWPPAAFHGVQS